MVKLLVSSQVFLSNLFLPSGIFALILWDNYFVPQLFSLNLQAPLPSHPSHDQVISEVSAVKTEGMRWKHLTQHHHIWRPTSPGKTFPFSVPRLEAAVPTGLSGI